MGLDLWRGSVLPSLLWGSEVWSDIPVKTMKALNDVNSTFLANLLGVSKRGCPEISLYVETSSLLISNQILLSQILFLHHIASLPATSLANETYQAMKSNEYPGLFKTCQKYLIEWNILDLENYSKWAFKKKIKNLITQKNWKDLMKWSEQYKKISKEHVVEKMNEQSSYIKKYNLLETRVLFRRASFLLQSVRLNWKNSKKYREEGYDCSDCLSLDPPFRHPDHQDILVTPACLGNSDLRLRRDMSTERGQAQFFIDLISRRKERDKGHA